MIINALSVFYITVLSNKLVKSSQAPVNIVTNLNYLLLLFLAATNIFQHFCSLFTPLSLPQALKMRFVLLC